MSQTLTPEELERARQQIAELEAKISRSAEAVAVARAREHFMPFVKLTTTDPDAPDDVERSRYHDAKHHRAIATALEEVEAGRILRLILIAPPRHGKSELATRKFVPWFVGRDPYRHVIMSTYSDQFAADFGADVRNVMRHPRYKQVFPAAALRPGSAATDKLVTLDGGAMFFVGRRGGTTGRGADLLMIDDPFKDDKEAQSPTIREDVWNWFVRVANTRLMSLAARIVIIMTRWHEDDLVGRLTDPENPCYVEDEARKWKIIHLPALAEDDDALGRAVGEPLWPERFPREYLESMRRLDPRGFSALYQGHPAPEDGDFFKAEYIKTYIARKRPAVLRYYVASDHAVSLDARADKTCIIVAGVDDEGEIYLVECWWQRAPTNTVVEAMVNIMRRYRPLAWYAERGHISKSIGPFLRKRMLEEGVHCAVIEQTPVADKVTRAQSIQGRMAMGRVHFPAFLPWYGAARDELLKFPNATHDDFVDALAHLGLGLATQVKAGKVRAQPLAEPKVGTIEWVKWQANNERREREAMKAAGGY